MRPIPTDPLDVFWYWINERHRIYLKRERGEAPPWTADPILQQNKFTNVFRRLDRGTAWLLEEWLTPREELFAAAVRRFRERRRNEPVLGNLVANTAMYRMLNWWPSGKVVGWRDRWEPAKWKPKLAKIQEAGGKVFTSAHVIRSHFGMPKLDSLELILAPIWKDRHQIARDIIDNPTIEYAFQRFTAYDLVGPFMAYEFATDLTYTPLLSEASDRMSWANPGPGCTRGLQAIWPQLRTRAQLIEGMQKLLQQSTDRLEGHVPGLEMRDIEMSLCEVYKYLKVQRGEGKTRERFHGGSRSLYGLGLGNGTRRR